ncbi:MAG TPA: hypothetical protein VF024_15940, partial [Solirubrobacteraceae bacterium]
MTRRDDDIPVELRDVAAQLRALGPEEWEPAPPPALRAPVAEEHDRAAPPDRGRARRRGRLADFGARRRARVAVPVVLRPGLAAVAALMLLALGAAGGALLFGDGGGGGAAGREVALAPIGDGPRGAHADALLQRAAMRLTVSGLPRVGGGGFYEVWMLRDPAHLVA